MFVARTFERTEHDDFVLNVQNKVDEFSDAVPVYDSENKMIGWKIKSRFE